jgi:glycopeptide antibiotics resistance protein
VSAIPALQSLLGRPTFWAVVVVGLLALLGVVGLLRRRGATGSAMALATAGFVVVVIEVLLLTLFGPDPEAPQRLFLDPLDGAWGWSGIAWRPVLDNVALFVPVGAFAAAVWWRRHVLAVWIGCVLGSVGIEAFQYLVPTGRIANSADVLANATGAALGIALTVLAGARVAPPLVSPAPPRR